MIISASRRTDITAFYTKWFMNRIRAGYCSVPNPINRKISRVSLRRNDVEVIVFWTRNPRPIFPYLKELDQQGYRYYFQYTIMNNPRLLDNKTPPLESSLKFFKNLSDLVGSEKVIWRYDPIVFSQKTDAQFHIHTYKRIAEALRGYTNRSVISILDIYHKAKKRLRILKEQGVEIMDTKNIPDQFFDDLMFSLVEIAGSNDMEISSCAENLDLKYGIKPGKCIDDDYISETFGIKVPPKKDISQRGECGCIRSTDIGVYDTCRFNCQYCYATRSFETAELNFKKHDPTSSSII